VTHVRSAQVSVSQRSLVGMTTAIRGLLIDFCNA
jgi:hypothetical protein